MKKLKRIIAPVALASGIGVATTALFLYPFDVKARTSHKTVRTETESKTIKPTNLASKKNIKVALLLDTSNSMDGLINQAKSQLWKLVNELTKAECDGEKPNIQIALYQYGNQGLSVSTGYIEQILDFTGELDEVSAKLFALSTNGGDEYCGQVIQKSTQELSWGTNESDLKFIFIAGNEAFTQGPVNFTTSCLGAKEKDIVVNTIFCGDYRQGVSTNWKAGADLTDGSYMSIDHDQKTAYISTPFDDRIDSLNTAMNDTYIYYGHTGQTKMANMAVQDVNASSISKENKIDRAVTKSKKTYQRNTKSWDLVKSTEGLSDEDIETQLKSIDKSTLSEEVAEIEDTEKQIAFIKQKSKERETIQKEIEELAVKRETYIQANSNAENKDLNAAIMKSVKKKAASKNYKFK